MLAMRTRMCLGAGSRQFSVAKVLKFFPSVSRQMQAKVGTCTKRTSAAVILDFCIATVALQDSRTILAQGFVCPSITPTPLQTLKPGFTRKVVKSSIESDNACHISGASVRLSSIDVSCNNKRVMVRQKN